MLFSDVAAVFDEVEKRSGRIEMTQVLAELFKQATAGEIEKLVYFVQGIVAPPYEGIDLGMGERFAVEAIASAAGYAAKAVDVDYKKSGDLGTTAENFLAKKKQLSLGGSDVTVLYLHDALMKIAKTSGTGSTELKKKYLVELLNNTNALEARYIVRFVLGRLRLGVGDPTILDALSTAKTGDKAWRERLERAYNVCADMGYVARLFYEDDTKIEKFTVTPFKPLMPALAERLSTPEEIIEKLGKCGVEGKYDGFRCISGYTQLYIKNKGLLSARDVKVGDYTLTHTGKFRKITAKNKRTKDKNEKIFRLQTYLGNEFKITEGHPVLIEKNGKDKWVNVEDIPVGSWVVFPVPKITSSTNFPKRMNLEDCGYTKEVILDKEFFRFLGFWIGDGYTNEFHNTERVGLIFNEKTEKKLCSYYETIIRRKFKIKDISRNLHNGAIYLYWRDKPLRIWLSENFRREWKGKMLPEWFVNIPKKYYKEFLNGWLEADGEETAGRKIITTKESDLAAMAQLIALKNGILIGVKRFRVKERDYYQIRITKDKKKALIRNNKVYIKLFKKENIRTDPRFKVYNFQVETDESYCVPMLTLHNCQIHKVGDRIEIYSRRLDKLTHMFPEVVEAVKKLKEKEIIFEGEALAYNAKEQRYYSFQQTMHRRRKHGVDAASEELPLNIFCFDLLYLNGKDYTTEPYAKRRAKIEAIFKGPLLKTSEQQIVSTAEQLQELFEDALKRGLEGIIAKDLTAAYAAGKRKFAWIKLKKSYGSSVDTIDGVIVGYYLGKGARVQFEFGGLLIAVYNQDKGRFETVAKIGSGFSEDEMRLLKEMLDKIKRATPPADLDFRMEPDFWVEPKYVIEVAFDDITLSPTHTAGMHGDKGYALRFPRMMRMRDDKSITEATTSDEVKEMYETQRGKGKK